MVSTLVLPQETGVIPPQQTCCPLGPAEKGGIVATPTFERKAFICLSSCNTVFPPTPSPSISSKDKMLVFFPFLLFFPFGCKCWTGPEFYVCFCDMFSSPVTWVCCNHGRVVLHAWVLTWCTKSAGKPWPPFPSEIWAVSTGQPIFHGASGDRTPGGLHTAGDAPTPSAWLQLCSPRAPTLHHLSIGWN